MKCISISAATTFQDKNSGGIRVELNLGQIKKKCVSGYGSGFFGRVGTLIFLFFFSGNKYLYAF